MEELNRLGIDLNQDFIADTPNGNLLHEIWNIRQAEVKKAVEGLMKPAEFMKDIMNLLRNSTDDSLKIKNLVILESLLADVDNSRDFHTIGGWPVLLGLLQSNYSLEIRAHASWCIGTAVKNDYDYQLWILENVDTSIGAVSGLRLLLDNFRMTVDYLTQARDPLSLQRNYDLTKRILYALASCLRGNMDVQEALQQSSLNVNFPLLLHRLTSSTLDLRDSRIRIPSNSDDLVVLRKIWSLISDMIDEVAYLREGLISEILLERQSQGTGTRIDGDTLESKIKEATNHIHPLGDLFLINEGVEMNWYHLTSLILRHLTDGCVIVEQVASGDGPTISPTPSTASHVGTIANVAFNESCPIFASASIRSIYESIANCFGLMSRYASPSIIDEELSRRIQSISSHSTMLA